MPKYQDDLPAERVRELLDYDPNTGHLSWRANKGAVKAGDAAGYKHSQHYVLIGIDGKNYYAHRLAWVHVHGRWPAEQLDHINGIRHDNRLANLREATLAENNQNLGIRRNNTSGHPGVSWSKACRKWEATISINKVRTILGRFADINDAISARAKAKAEQHPFHPIDRISDHA